MKTEILLVLFSTLVFCNNIYAEKNRIAETEPPKSGDEEIAQLVNDPAPEYVPGPGQIAFSIKDVVDELTEIRDGVPIGEQGQDSPWFSKLTILRDGLAATETSKLQQDLFNQIERIEDLFLSGDATTPAFVDKSIEILHMISITMRASIQNHIIEQNGNISNPNAILFSKVFATDDFTSEADGETISDPIDGEGIFILNPSGITAAFKSQSWKRAKQFLGYNMTASDFFERYTANGNGLALLKTKYAADKAAIDAKFEELKTWVDQQKQQEEQQNDTE